MKAKCLRPTKIIMWLCPSVGGMYTLSHAAGAWARPPHLASGGWGNHCSSARGKEHSVLICASPGLPSSAPSSPPSGKQLAHPPWCGAALRSSQRVRGRGRKRSRRRREDSA